MQKLSFVPIIIFSFQVVFGQNGLKNGSLFLLQKAPNTYSINAFENDRINELQTFKVSKKSILATDQRERVAILDTARNKIRLIDLKTSKETKLSIPFDIKPKTLLINQHNLFVGGVMGQELLVQYHLKTKKWYRLKIPKAVMAYGKAVDDIVVNDSLLIAVDNLIIPKYILYYKLNAKDSLAYSHFKMLKSNSSYESIHKARITEQYLGLLSTTMNWGTTREHITLYSDLNLLSSFSISSVYWEKLNFSDILIVGNKLYIANRTKGLGVLEIKKAYFRESRKDYVNINKTIDEELIQYNNDYNGEIIRLTRIPEVSKIVLTIRNRDDSIKSEIIDLE